MNLSESPTGAPWARVRLVDLTVPDRPACNRCEAGALLQFRVEYQTAALTMDPGSELTEVHTTDETHDLFACQEHMGALAFTAAYGLLRAPQGGV